MPSQKHKKKQKQKLLQNTKQNCLSIKTIFERNEPSTSSHTDTHYCIYKMIYRFYMKLFNPKKHTATITLITNQMKIIVSTFKIQNIRILLLTESQRKNRPKYIDFPKTLFGKFSRSFSSKRYKELLWMHDNLQ